MLPLSATLPLRTTAALGRYSTVQTIPWAYGRVTLTPAPYDRFGAEWVIDHPIAGLDAATRDDIPTQAVAWRNDIDPTGRPVAIITLAEPLAAGERLAVTVRGRIDAQTGALITNPADVVYDVLTQLAGSTIERSNLDWFRADCTAAGLVIAGVLDDRAMTIRALLAQILGSVAAEWSGGMPGFARLWPRPGPRPVRDIPADKMDPPTVTSDAADLVTSVRVLAGFNWATRTPSVVVPLVCAAAVERYGDIPAELDARWLPDARSADEVGRRWLARRCRPEWSGTLGVHTDYRRVRAGDDVTLDHPHLPPCGTWLVTDAVRDDAAGSLQLTVRANPAPEPVITTGAVGNVYEPIPPGGLNVIREGNIVTLTYLDETGQPMVGATVTIADVGSRLTDARGQVRFEGLARGTYEVVVEREGYVPLIGEVTI